jgi:hypothetical protein
MILLAVTATLIILRRASNSKLAEKICVDGFIIVFIGFAIFGIIGRSINHADFKQIFSEAESISVSKLYNSR